MVLAAGDGGRRTGLRVVLAPLIILVLSLSFWPAGRAFLGLAPAKVLVIYVREENSRGLLALPFPGEEGRSGLDPTTTRLTLPGGSRQIGRQVRAVVLRETFVAGFLVESRVVYLSRYPSYVEGRAPGLGLGDRVDSGCALLAVDLAVSSGKATGGSSVSVRVEVPGLTLGAGGETVPAVVIEPGREWRLGAVVERGGQVLVLLPDDLSFESLFRQAFYDDRPVSIISVLNCGLWDTDRIETRDDSGG